MSLVQTDVGRQSKIVVAGILVFGVAIGYIVITWYANNTKTPSQISAGQFSGKGLPTQESERYTQVLEKYNKEQATVAEQKGQSYLSVPSTKPVNVTDQASPSQLQPLQQMDGQYQQSQTINNLPLHDPQQVQKIDDQIAGLLSNWTPVSHATARVSDDSAEYAKSISLRAENTSTQRLASSTLLQPAQKIVDDFELVAGLLNTDIDTDENSIVKASIPSGKYAGAEVFAMGYKRINNSVDLTFTFMKWQGHSYKITAKAMDRNTMRTALSGEVNNRYFSRIIIPAIAAGIGRTGQLYEQANAQNIITPQGGIIQTYPATPNATAVIGTMVGGIASQAGQVLANDAASMPAKQVLIPKGETIGIQFIGPVLVSDDMAAGSNVPVDLHVLSQPASQSGRMYGQPEITNNGYNSTRN